MVTGLVSGAVAELAGGDFADGFFLGGVAYAVNAVASGVGKGQMGRKKRYSNESLKDKHYNRNDNMEVPFSDEAGANAKSWKLQPDWKNIYHRGEAGSGHEFNVKYLSSDGHHEAIFTRTSPDGFNTGHLVTDPKYYGTYNYGTNWFTHVVLDVIPYKIWGNTPDTLNRGPALNELPSFD